MKIYLSKNDKKEKDNQPDLYLKQIAKEGEFVEIGALWKAKSGKGYSGNINLDKIKFLKEEWEEDRKTNTSKKYDKSGDTAKEIKNDAPIEYPSEEIDVSDIPF